MAKSPWQQAIIDGLEAIPIDHFLHVPGGPLAPIIAHFQDAPAVKELPVSREEEGIGVLCGLAWGQRRPVLMMQDNGLGNAIGMIATLAKAYHVPALILSVRRGGLTEYNSAMHYFTEHVPGVLAAVDIKTFTLNQQMTTAEWRRRLPLAYQHSLMTHRPVVTLLELDES